MSRKSDDMESIMSGAALIIISIFLFFMAGALISELTDGKSWHPSITYKEYWNE